MSSSQEEEIARDYICFGNPDCTVIVVDATCLERNLNLVFQVLEITNKVVVCVNLLDEAHKKGIEIDLDKLSFKLGVPVVGTIARKKKTLKNLMENIYKVCLSSNDYNTSFKLKYPNVIEEAINIVEKNVKPIIFNNNFNNSRWITLKLLEGNKKIISSIENYLNINLLTNPDIQISLSNARNLLEDNNINLSAFKDKLVSTIMFHCENMILDSICYKKSNYNQFNTKIDKILTSKLTGVPIMFLFFAMIFWITIAGANYPSTFLSNFFNFIEGKLIYFFQTLNSPDWLVGVLIYGMYRTLGWVIAVMLPPMAIFFPLFTILEDLGYLPRIAFNLDNFFRKACTSGKQALTMCMGFGCNAAGVVGSRIIDSPRERLISILTNNFVPCNRKISFFNYYCFNIYCWNKFWSLVYNYFDFGYIFSNNIRNFNYFSHF